MSESAGIAPVTPSPAPLANVASAQVAGTTAVGVSSVRLESIAPGWSAKKQIIGQTVLNRAGEKVGSIDDLIFSPNSAVPFALVGAGVGYRPL